ncbi:hypothetical protein [Streptomyces hydrogenans]|uniref:hypothetical protein n=1 Tax=Streptomyces hydrogenans TaxID=1873719 RepID=UPI0033D03FBD
MPSPTGGRTARTASTREGTLCEVIDFGDLCAGDPPCAQAVASPCIRLPDGSVDRVHPAHGPAVGPAWLRRAQGWTARRALGGPLIGEAGVHGAPAATHLVTARRLLPGPSSGPGRTTR